MLKINCSLNFFLLSLLFFQFLIFSHFFASIVLQYFSWQKITFSCCHLLEKTEKKEKENNERNEQEEKERENGTEKKEKKQIQ